MLTAVNEENVQKVVEWLQRNPEDFPAIGVIAYRLASSLAVTAVEVNIANRRLVLGLAPKTAPIAKFKARKTAVSEEK